MSMDRSLTDADQSRFNALNAENLAFLTEFDRHDLACLKKCYYGASIMPVEVLKEMLERLPGAKIYNYYGQTELAPYHTILKAGEALAKLGSAGMARPAARTCPPARWRRPSTRTSGWKRSP
ncbi:MAG: AMP-binding protein [Desulfobacteraceae bacterium]|jgi:acyl-CoA synthetase (AMP-forming)/AMP-acid ligase II|nr:AMP-binding protein [Desulfobacteraceae bacterium]